MNFVRRLLLASISPLLLASVSAGRSTNWDVVVYGDTPAAVTAAVQAKRQGKATVIVAPNNHLGGMMSDGLGSSDVGNGAVIGGLALEFFQRVYAHYAIPTNWRWGSLETYTQQGTGRTALAPARKAMWYYEPKVAESIFEALVAENLITVLRGERLDRSPGGVTKEGDRLLNFRTLDGQTITGNVFIDATYEGDLMAAAGATYRVGREAKAEYSEEFNGVQTGVLHHRHHFGVLKNPISAYWIPGDPSSGLLPEISAEPPGAQGAADQRVQAYCYRLCLTQEANNRIPFSPPPGYDPKRYELLARVYEAGWNETFRKFEPVPNSKTDSNNHGPFSFDYIGGNYAYPEADYDTRRQIEKEHEYYQRGLLYFTATDPRVPKALRERMQRYGLPRDEFTDNGGWPRQLYIREARRLVGEYVLHEADLRDTLGKEDSVGVGSYTIDSHNVQRYVTPEGWVQNEGDIGVPTKGPYEIPLRSLLPRRGEVSNLLVPVCISSTHIAYGSVRMEPVFMILGQSAGAAAALLVDKGGAVQDLPYSALLPVLLQYGQILHTPGPTVRPTPTSAGVSP